jgi:hypothetical protein
MPDLPLILKYKATGILQRDISYTGMKGPSLAHYVSFLIMLYCLDFFIYMFDHFFDINPRSLHLRPHLILFLRILDNARLTFSPLPNGRQAYFS